MMADLRLRPEAETTLIKYTNTGSSAPSATFHKTDMSDWSQISSLWEITLKTFSRIDIVVNGAGLYEPPSSAFWYPAGISPLAEDPADAQVGQYKTFAVNTIGPIRLAQIAIDYWLENRDVKGNLLWIASVGGYVHSLQTPLYLASKAAIVSVVKSFARLRKDFGIRNSVVCPGVVYVRFLANPLVSKCKC
jgi:NAD(P)-dependent dehydrogenase (short-subunit alcohol dehydrogenase family)